MDVNAAPGAGLLSTLEVDGSVRPRLGDLTIPNGIDWTNDGPRVLYADSTTHRVDAFDVTAGGGLGTRRPWVSLSDDVLPDGLTVDAEDGLWVALWGGAAVHHYSAGGEPLERLELPAAQVTSCAFGGPELSDLYVTTAAQGLSASDRVEQPLAGALCCFPSAGAEGWRTPTEAESVRQPAEA